MSARTSAAERAESILSVAIAHEGKPLTRTELARLCGRGVGRTFSTDLAAARHLAFDRGWKLSNCAPTKRGEQRLVFRRYEGDDITFRGLRTQAGQANTRIRNVGRSGEWEAKHGETEYAQQYGAVCAKISMGVTAVLEGLNDIGVFLDEQQRANARQ